MLCYHASYPYLKKALETLTSIYTWENYYKDDGKVWDGRRISDEAEFIYNGRDCCVTREIWPLVERDAKELGTWEGYRRTMSVIPSLLEMQIRGVRIDIEKKKGLQSAVRERVVEAESTLVETTGQNWNLNSSPQMIRLVYGYLGLPMQYNHKTKKPTTDKDALNRLRRKHPENKVLKAIIDHRKYAKLSNTYADMKVAVDMLRDKEVAPKTVLKIVPATRRVLGDMITNNDLQVLFAARTVVSNPGCAGCASGQIGMTGKGEIQVSTGNRNFKGKQGSGMTYLCSPETVTASSIAGKIISPDNL